jgi:cephalosporin-C deacetylase
MPLIDMPLEELRKYQGRNPCPSDMDEYWDAALQEMRSVDPQIKMVPADFKVPYAECFDLYFTGVGNARIHAKYIRPDGKPEPHPAVVQFHGYYDFAGYWNTKLNYVSQGFSIASIDVRGQAGISEDTGTVKGTTFRGHIIRGLDDKPEKLLFRSIYLDTAQLAGIVMGMPEVDPERVGAIGDSQGGGLTLACASLEPRIKRLAPTFPFLSDYKRVWEMDLAKDAYLELKEYFRAHDPLHEREDEIFTRLGYVDVQHLVKRIKGEVLMGVGLMDTMVPASTQFAAYNKITSPKQVLVYPDFGHEAIPHYTDRIFQFMMKL